MTVAKIIEVKASSPTSFEDAVREGIGRATKTVENVCGAWVKDQSVIIEANEIKEYRVGLKVTFLLK